MGGRELVFVSVLFGTGIACGPSPTTSSKAGIEDIRVVGGPSRAGSDATGVEWSVGWTVFVDAGTPPTDAPPTGGAFIRDLAAPVSIDEVSSTIVAPDGHVLATIITSAPQISVMNFIAVNTGTTQVTPDRGIIVNQTVRYDTSAPSPTSQAARSPASSPTGGCGQRWVCRSRCTFW